MLRSFILKPDGSVSLSRESEIVEQSRLSEILATLQRTDYTADEVMPLISTEIRRLKTAMVGCTSFSDSQKYKRRLHGFYLVRDLAMASSGLVDYDDHKIDLEDHEKVESEVLRFLRKCSCDDNTLGEVDMEGACQTETFGDVFQKCMIELISDGMPVRSD